MKNLLTPNDHSDLEHSKDEVLELLKKIGEINSGEKWSGNARIIYTFLYSGQFIWWYYKV